MMMQRVLSLTKTLASRFWVHNSYGNIFAANYSIFNKTFNQSKLLPTTLPSINPICNLKVKGKVRRRCKSCYFVYRHERLYIMCAEHPRHKQILRAPKPHNTWILTHASQSKVRPW